METILVGLYLPPLASLKLLHKLNTIIATMDNIIFMGDFIMFLDPGVCTTDGITQSDLSAWVEADVWRGKIQMIRPSAGIQHCTKSSLVLI